MPDGRIELLQFREHRLLLDRTQVEIRLHQHRDPLLLQLCHPRVCAALEPEDKPDLLVDILLFLGFPLLLELVDFVFRDYLSCLYMYTSDLSPRTL